MNSGDENVFDTPRRRYVAGSHSDYYLLLDEESNCIFNTRLAEHIREARSHGRAGLAAGRLPEIWMDHKGKRVWYVFDASLEGEVTS